MKYIIKYVEEAMSRMIETLMISLERMILDKDFTCMNVVRVDDNMNADWPRVLADYCSGIFWETMKVVNKT